jgi:hypothetical protein
MFKHREMRPLRRQPQYTGIRRHITCATQAVRSLPRRRARIMINGVPRKGKGDSSSEKGQKGATIAVSDFKHTSYASRSIRRHTSGEYASPRRHVYDRELVNSDHKEKKDTDTRPANRRGKQSKKNNRQKYYLEYLQLRQLIATARHAKDKRNAGEYSTNRELVYRLR